MCQLGGDVGGQSRNPIIKLGVAGFKLLEVELSFQVHEPGFWGMLKNGGTLKTMVLTLSFTVPWAMVLLHGNLTLITEKKKSGTTLFVYFDFAVMKTGSEVLSFEDG